ncbi:MAG: hypothetical protein H7233_09380 [Pseudorhodobacter sp.]|nr:hypothetical protein [Frankiaceae bacterium]
MSTPDRTNHDPRSQAPRPPVGAPGTLRRGGAFVLLAAALAAGTGYVVSDFILPEVYRSSATIIVNNIAPSVPDDSVVPIEPFVDDQSLSETFEQLALQPAVMSAVAADLGMPVEELAARTRVHAVPRTPLVVISHDASTPELAARGAQAYTAIFVQGSRRSGLLPGRALIVSGATLPNQSSAPRTLLNTLVAGLAGLLLGVLALVARSQTLAAREARDPARGLWPPSSLPAWPDGGQLVTLNGEARRYGTAQDADGPNRRPSGG